MANWSNARFDVPLYACAEAARHLDLPGSTFRTWTKGSSPLVCTLPAESRGWPCVPFVGLVEGLVLSALRRAGLPPQQIRPVVELVRARIGAAHPLASRKFAEVGARVLGRAGDAVVRRNGRHAFEQVMRRCFRRITYDETHARRLLLPGYEVARIAVDPEMNFGRPYFVHTGTPVFAVTGPLKAGETIEDTAADFDLPVDQVTEVARRHLGFAA